MATIKTKSVHLRSDWTENWGSVAAEVSLRIYTPRSNSRALVYHIIYVTSPLLTLGVPNAYVHAQAARVRQVICTFTLGAAASTCGAQGCNLCLRGHRHPKRLDLVEASDLGAASENMAM